MNSVRLYYIKHDGAVSLAQIDRTQQDLWLSELSKQKRTAVKRLVNNSDQLASLLGLRLLKLCAQDNAVAEFRLSDLLYPKSGKPGWRGKTSFDFNISHSENMILAASSKTMQLGVDVEKIRTLKSLNFNRVLSADELAKISETPELFFDFWSKKEAVVKAANTAGLARMHDVVLNVAD